MAGLMGGNPQDPGAQAPGATGQPAQPGSPAAGDMTAGAGAPEGEGDQPTPEEQELYNQFVSNAAKLIYSPEIRKSIEENLSGNGNPIEGFARTLVLVVSRAEQSALENDIKIPGDVMYAGADEIMDLLIEYAGEAGIATLTDEQAEQAWYLALDMYREKKEAAGELDPEAMAQDMQEIAAAEEAGNLDQMLPGIGQAMKRGEKQAPGNPEQEA